MDLALGIAAGLAFLAAVAGCWRGGARLGRWLPGRRGEAAAAGLLLATLVLVWFVNREPSRIPMAVVLSPFVYLEFGYFAPPAAALFGLAVERSPRNARALRALAAVLALYGAAHLALALDARSHEGLSDRPPAGVVARQTTGWSCGAAACVTLLRARGIESTEREMGELCLTLRKRGTTMLRFRRGLALKLRKEGLPARVAAGDRLSVSELDTFPLPCILGIRFTFFTDHAVVLLDRTPDGGFRIADPLTGTVRVHDRGELEERFTGEAVGLE